MRPAFSPLTAEVVPSPADAHLVRVADRHVRSQKVALVVLVVQVPRPHDVAELFGGDLHTCEVSFQSESRNGDAWTSRLEGPGIDLAVNSQFFFFLWIISQDFSLTGESHVISMLYVGGTFVFLKWRLLTTSPHFNDMHFNDLCFLMKTPMS